MKVRLNEKPIELEDGSDVSDALNALKVNPETVLVKRSGKLIPHDAKLKNGDVLETISVISGG